MPYEVSSSSASEELSSCSDDEPSSPAPTPQLRIPAGSVHDWRPVVAPLVADLRVDERGGPLDQATVERATAVAAWRCARRLAFYQMQTGRRPATWSRPSARKQCRAAAVLDSVQAAKPSLRSGIAAVEAGIASYNADRGADTASRHGPRCKHMSKDTDCPHELPREVLLPGAAPDDPARALTPWQQAAQVEWRAGRLLCSPEDAQPVEESRSSAAFEALIATIATQTTV